MSGLCKDCRFYDSFYGGICNLHSRRGEVEGGDGVTSRVLVDPKTFPDGSHALVFTEPNFGCIQFQTREVQE